MSLNRVQVKKDDEIHQLMEREYSSHLAFVNERLSEATRQIMEQKNRWRRLFHMKRVTLGEARKKMNDASRYDILHDGDAYSAAKTRIMNRCDYWWSQIEECLHAFSMGAKSILVDTSVIKFLGDK